MGSLMGWSRKGFIRTNFYIVAVICMEKLITLREAANVTGRPYTYWWRLTKRSELPCIKTAGRILVRPSVVEKWILDQEAASIAYTNN